MGGFRWNLSSGLLVHRACRCFQNGAESLCPGSCGYGGPVPPCCWCHLWQSVECGVSTLPDPSSLNHPYFGSSQPLPKILFFLFGLVIFRIPITKDLMKVRRRREDCLWLMVRGCSPVWWGMWSIIVGRHSSGNMRQLVTLHPQLGSRERDGTDSQLLYPFCSESSACWMVLLSG